MKNKKLVVVFILTIVFLSFMVTFTKASDGMVQLPTIVTDPNAVANGNVGSGAGNNTANNEVYNNVVGNNTTNTNTNAINIAGNNTNTTNNETLPQTGVAGDTTLFVFIAISIISAVYAYLKIRKYNNIH